MACKTWILAFAAVGVAVGGCSSTSGRYASPLPAAPSQPVASGQLQPIEPAPAPVEQPLEEPTDTGMETQVASLPDQTSALELQKNDLLGGWGITSAGETCQLFMTLTTWTGGYRASTRGCQGEELSTISAWELSGKQIVLKNGDGANVATLLAIEPGKFNGATVTGRGITVFR
ncbi:AprI/Inh family metalloprotease inhibitor [Amorphus sp. 3PC139-8]|uniref:AprI/Inh family metalloprotease inhibitor n=1 Tax=Amorphus sp. 3PC139-8 TaxID=2735676 RepID=UPI00345CCB73